MPSSLNSQFDDIWFSYILERFGLADMWEFIRETNPSKDLTYHNTEHMYRMAQIAYKLYTCRLVNVDKEAILLISACLWHDYGHSGGKEPDGVNIANAVRSLREWNHGSHYFSQEDLDIVGRLIYVTEFPFIRIPNGPLEICIRDADLLYVLSDQTGEITDGLYQELQDRFTAEEFINGQTTFWTNAQMYTRYGARLKNALADEAVKKQKGHFFEKYGIVCP